MQDNIHVCEARKSYLRFLIYISIKHVWLNITNVYTFAMTIDISIFQQCTEHSREICICYGWTQRGLMLKHWRTVWTLFLQIHPSHWNSQHRLANILFNVFYGCTKKHHFTVEVFQSHQYLSMIAVVDTLIKKSV